MNFVFRAPKLHLLPRFIATVIKRSLPKTLAARAILIIVLPVAMMQVAVTYVFFDRHWETVTARLSESLAGDIGWAVSSYQSNPTPDNLNRIAAEANHDMQLSIAFAPNQALPLSNQRFGQFYIVLNRTMDKALKNRLDEPYWFDTSRYPGVVDIRVKVKGGVLRIIAPRDRAFANTGFIFLFWILGATLVLTSISILFIRNQVRAIERLSRAARAFGRGEEDPNFKPYGATEVREAAKAFLDMKARIGHHIEQRTTLLASVSHDLRTPLTRLKLELALCEDSPMAERMKGDVSEMAYMIDEYLAFARGEMSEVLQIVALKPFMIMIKDNMARSGHDLDLVMPELDYDLHFRLSAMQRALTNLILNGFHHAKHVRLSAVKVLAARDSHEAGSAYIDFYIDDDGPGIAPDKREDALKAFNRLDDSRNQNTTGVGLGLAIARDIIRSHGGELTLEESPMSGLRVAIRLKMP